MNRILSSFIHRGVALVLAFTYFGFQAEVFEEEYEANHPQPTNDCAISSPSLTWESFDKNNAPQPFVFDADIRFQCLLLFVPQAYTSSPYFEPFQLIRDKSPPSVLI